MARGGVSFDQQAQRVARGFVATERFEQTRLGVQRVGGLFLQFGFDRVAKIVVQGGVIGQRLLVVVELGQQTGLAGAQARHDHPRGQPLVAAETLDQAIAMTNHVHAREGGADMGAQPGFFQARAGHPFAQRGRLCGFETLLQALQRLQRGLVLAHRRQCDRLVVQRACDPYRDRAGRERGFDALLRIGLEVRAQRIGDDDHVGWSVECDQGIDLAEPGGGQVLLPVGGVAVERGWQLQHARYQRFGLGQGCLCRAKRWGRGGGVHELKRSGAEGATQS